MKIKYYIFALLIFLPAEFYPSGGSIYSRFGLGDFYFSFSARRMALGELGIASADADYLNYLNPAGWNKMRLSRFETGVLYHGNSISSNSASVFHAQTIFSGMMFGFPVERNLGISFAGGIVPYSNVNYDVVVNDEDAVAGTYKTQYKGEGGLSKAFVGFSIKLPLDIAVGASFDYFTGRVEHLSVVEFLGDSDLLDASFSKIYNYSGVGYTIGLISNNFSSIIGAESLKDLRLGFTFSNSSKIGTDSVNTSSTLVGDVETSAGSIKTEIPQRIGIGLLLTLKSGYTITADYLFQPFSKLLTGGKSFNNMRDLTKYSLGVEYRNPEPRSQSFWEQVMLRGGLSYEQTQYSINGNGIDQISLYTGFSMWLGFDNTIDLGLQVGKRGTKDNNLLGESFYKFSITLSIGELWFIRTER
ncbi:MAG: hypothetical protein RDU14_08055 [Melioribacteraceae bacterium]|nr:hypothetical protein [Melioribacteraceae bacterium]